MCVLTCVEPYVWMCVYTYLGLHVMCVASPFFGLKQAMSEMIQDGAEGVY